METHAGRSIQAQIGVTNDYDYALHRQGLLGANDMRSATLTVQIVAGAAGLTLPLDMIDRLGLLSFDLSERSVDESVDFVQKMYGPVSVQLNGRHVPVLALGSPVGSTAVLNAGSLYVFDLKINSENACLAPALSEGAPFH